MADSQSAVPDLQQVPPGLAPRARERPAPLRGCAGPAQAHENRDDPKTARLLKRLKKVEELPPADQRAVLKLVDALVATRRRTGSR